MSANRLILIEQASSNRTQILKHQSCTHTTYVSAAVGAMPLNGLSYGTNEEYSRFSPEIEYRFFAENIHRQRDRLVTGTHADAIGVSIPLRAGCGRGCGPVRTDLPIASVQAIILK
jgi:hypothetical protein